MDTFTYDEIAEYLTDGYWDAKPPNPTTGWQAGRNHFDVGPGDTLTVDVSDLSSIERQYVEAALEMWTDVTGINFAISTTPNPNADITFYNDDPSGAYAGAAYTSGGGISQYAIVNIPQSWVALYDGTPDSTMEFNYASYTFQTYLHEIGHALGLGHAGDYNGSGGWSDDGTGDNHYLNDSWQATVMSYFSQTENGFIDADYAYVVSPQIADILAIQDLYGTPTTTRTGNTTYGFNSNAGGMWDEITDLMTSSTGPVSFTIFDSGGIDTLDWSGFSDDQLINLNAGSISNIGGAVGNAMIATNTTIENAIGGSGNDEIIGNGVANNIQGGFGNDEIEGGGGADILFGNQGKDYIDGGDGGDIINGGLGRDRILGGDGADSIRGGGGNDVLKGQNGDDIIWGGNGKDKIWGGKGSDTMIGGQGADEFIFHDNDRDGSTDVIRDYVDGEDLITLKGFTITAGDITDLGGGVYSVDLGNGTTLEVTLTGNNGGDGVLTVDDFNFI